jgi:hypothetical protein
MSRGKKLVDLDFDEREEWAAGVLSGYKVGPPSQEQIDAAAVNAVRIAGRHLSPRARWQTRVMGRLWILGLILLVGVFSFRHIEPTVIHVPGTSVQDLNVDQLAAAAEIIVDVYPRGHKGSVLVNVDSRDYPLAGQTFTSVRVNKVLSGAGISSGAELVIIEPWAARRTWSGLYILTTDEYIAMSPGQRYTLFLTAGEDGKWAIVGGYQGRFVPLQLEADSELGDDFNLAERLHVTKLRPHYLELYRQVMARFGFR